MHFNGKQFQRRPPNKEARDTPATLCLLYLFIEFNSGTIQIK